MKRMMISAAAYIAALAIVDTAAAENNPSVDRQATWSNVLAIAVKPEPSSMIIPWAGFVDTSIESARSTTSPIAAMDAVTDAPSEPVGLGSIANPNDVWERVADIRNETLD